MFEYKLENFKTWLNQNKDRKEELTNWVEVLEKYSFSEWAKSLKGQESGTKYSAIIPTRLEPEYRTMLRFHVSSVGTDNKIGLTGILPLGSALLTDTLDGDGNGTSELYEKGINYIIHAAPEPRWHFFTDENFINCVVKSVQNSIILADTSKFEKLAIPLVGGGIYLFNCDPENLAEGIIIGALNQVAECQNLEEIIFVAFGEKVNGQEKYYLAETFEKIKQEGNYSEKIKKAKAVKGDICDKNLHGAEAIVNAANVQVKFGAGISEKMIKKTGSPKKIDEKAQALIAKLNSLIKIEMDNDLTAYEKVILKWVSQVDREEKEKEIREKIITILNHWQSELDKENPVYQEFERTIYLLTEFEGSFNPVWQIDSLENLLANFRNSENALETKIAQYYQQLKNLLSERKELYYREKAERLIDNEKWLTKQSPREINYCQEWLQIYETLNSKYQNKLVSEKQKIEKVISDLKNDIDNQQNGQQNNNLFKTIINSPWTWLVIGIGIGFGLVTYKRVNKKARNYEKEKVF